MSIDGVYGSVLIIDVGAGIDRLRIEQGEPSWCGFIKDPQHLLVLSMDPENLPKSPVLIV